MAIGSRNELEINERRERRIRQAIADAIEFWAQPYNDKIAGGLKGNDVMAYRFRAELEGRIYHAIEGLPRPKQKSN